MIKQTGWNLTTSFACIQNLQLLLDLIDEEQTLYRYITPADLPCPTMPYSGALQCAWFSSIRSFQVVMHV